MIKAGRKERGNQFVSFFVSYQLHEKHINNTYNLSPILSIICSDNKIVFYTYFVIQLFQHGLAA